MPTRHVPTAAPRMHCGATSHEAPRGAAASRLCEATAPCANVVSCAEGIAPIINSACGLQRRGLVVPSLHCLLGVLVLLLARLLEVCSLVLLVVMPACCMSTRHVPTAAPRMHRGATSHEAPRGAAASRLCEATAPCANVVSCAEGIAPIINSACGLQRRGLVVPSLHCLLGVLVLLLARLLEVCSLVLLVVMPACCMPTRHVPTAAPRMHCGATSHEAPRGAAASRLCEAT